MGIIYGNKFLPDNLDESVLSDIKKTVTDLGKLKEQWKDATKSFVNHKWIYRYVNESQKAKLQSYYQKLCEEDISYADYRRYFSHICRFMGIPNDKVIIENLVFEKDKKDKDQDIVAVQYSKGLLKVEIPDGVRLIHVSPADNIEQLNPSFRSKLTGRYLYPTKRCFFTVAKEIKPTQAALEGKKLTRYTTKQDIKYAYIDPTYSNFSSRSVYVETLKPIPVEKFITKMEKIFGKILHKEDAIEEDYDIDQFVMFEDYDESIYTEEEILQEGFKETIELIKNWKTSNEANRIKKFKSTTLSEEEYKEIKDCINMMKTVETYTEYKKYFNKFCKFCHIVPTGVIIKKYDLTKNKFDDKYTLDVEYSENTKKIQLPEGINLYHLSKIPGIKNLIPQFRGKSERGYFYDKPRIYFTIHKNMPKFLADYKVTQKMYKYKCKKDISDVYVDPLVYSNVQGAVYVETNKDIPVDEITNKESQESKEETKTNETFEFESFFEFVMENGFRIVEE